MVSALNRMRAGNHYKHDSLSTAMNPAAVDFIPYADVVTLDGLFRERVRRTPQAVAYRYYEDGLSMWTEISWQDMAQSVSRWRAAMQREALQSGDRVALLLRNSCQWVIYEQAALSLGLVVVPLYVNDRPENISYILQETDSKLLLIEDDDHWQILKEALVSVTSLQRIVSWRPVADGEVDARMRFIDDWLPQGESELQHRSASPDELATIVYTSGTVGRPKGVMLSHANIMWNAYACQQVVAITRDDVFLSFLPLSHMLERTVGYVLPMMAGATVAFARSIPQLAEDLVTQRPTVLISVPRIYERIFARIQAQLVEQPARLQKLFALAVSAGWHRFEKNQGRAGWHPLLLLQPLLQRLVADKVMARMGGRIRVAVCGGAPLGFQVARFFIGLGLPLLCGYGLTETAPVLNANRLDKNDPQGVGPAVAGVEERISEDGELLVRSPGIMLGYWRNEQATREMIDEDGWLHSADKARIENGHVYITGRLKDIIVMSNGEKMPPADMELAITMDPLFEQVMVLGEGRPYLAALLVLDQKEWVVLAQREGVDPYDSNSLTDIKILDLLCRRVSDQLQQFPGYAQIRRVSAMLEPWTVENGLLTPTLKLRRNRMLEQFAETIEVLYKGH